jgi:glycosyltransferase involved in cell wall biosynthesis
MIASDSPMLETGATGLDTPEGGTGAGRSLTVVHVVLSLNVGGLERVVLDLARCGERSGQKVAVVCIDEPGQLAPALVAEGTEVHCVFKRPGLRPGLVRHLAELLRGLSADVVHTHQVGALIYAGPAARRARVPVVVHTEHGKNYGARWRTRLLGRLAGRYAQRFFCVSQDIASEVAERRIVPASKVRVAHNGIDTARSCVAIDGAAVRAQLGIPASAPVVGMVGRLTEIKRPDLLLRAFAGVSRILPDAYLLIVGDGPLMGELVALAEALDVAPRVRFAGYQPRPQDFFRIMDVFALTSRSEGMPLVILEAWAAGLPVVGSAVGGIPELLGSGCGRLFEPGSVAELQRALEELLVDRDAARRIGESGRKRVLAAFDVRHMAERYQANYLELLSHRRDRGPAAP